MPSWFSSHRRSATTLLTASLTCVSLAALGPATASAQTVSTPVAKTFARQALFKWIGTFTGVSSASDVKAPFLTKLSCRKRTAKTATCSYRYMPGNTVYSGALSIRLVSAPAGSRYRAKVKNRGTYERLPPAKPFRRSGTFTIR
jgi:hypothetical protein